MTLQQLQYFRVTAQTLHYTKAAKILHISQPSLSYSLAQLENELDIKLFRKVGKQVFLTDLGQSFMLSVDKVLTELEESIDNLQAMKKNSQKEIRLGYIQSLSSTFIPRIIEEYYQHKCADTVPFIFAPNQQFDLIGDLKCGKLDIVICANEDETLNCKKIAEQELVLIVPKHHPFVTIGSVSINDLSGKPIIMLAKKTGIYSTVQKLFLEHNVLLNISKEACDFNAAINYVSLGKGISLIPRINSIEQYNVSTIRIRDVNCARPIYLLWSDVNENETRDDFIEFMKDYFGRI